MFDARHQGFNSWVLKPDVAKFVEGRVRAAEEDRMLVYTASQVQATELARILGCEAYHSDAIDKAGIASAPGGVGFWLGQVRLG